MEEDLILSLAQGYGMRLLALLAIPTGVHAQSETFPYKLGINGEASCPQKTSVIPADRTDLCTAAAETLSIVSPAASRADSSLPRGCIRSASATFANDLSIGAGAASASYQTVCSQSYACVSPSSARLNSARVAHFSLPPDSRTPLTFHLLHACAPTTRYA